MAIPAQTTANRKNSAHSTGPTSAAGKSTCSQNSLKHGLASSQLIIPGESEEEFNTFLTGLLTEHAPATLTETLLIQDMAKYHWLADRALRMQNDAIAAGPTALPSLGLLIRYHNANLRAFQHSFATLNASRKTQLAAIGSASQAAARAAKQAEAAAIAEAKQQQEEWLHAMLRDCAAPSAAQMNAAGYFRDPNTGLWNNPDQPE